MTNTIEKKKNIMKQEKIEADFSAWVKDNIEIVRDEFFGNETVFDAFEEFRNVLKNEVGKQYLSTSDVKKSDFDELCNGDVIAIEDILK